MVGPSFAPPVVRSTRLRLAPLTTGTDAHHFVNIVRSNPNFYNLGDVRTGGCPPIRPNLTRSSASGSTSHAALPFPPPACRLTTPSSTPPARPRASSDASSPIRGSHRSKLRIGGITHN